MITPEWDQSLLTSIIIRYRYALPIEKK